MIQAPAQPTFMQQIQPYLVTFCSMVLPTLGIWIVALLKASHAVQQSNATKLDNVVAATNGTNKSLQDHINNQTQIATALALKTTQDQLAALQAQIPKPPAQ